MSATVELDDATCWRPLLEEVNHGQCQWEGIEECLQDYEVTKENQDWAFQVFCSTRPTCETDSPEGRIRIFAKMIMRRAAQQAGAL